MALTEMVTDETAEIDEEGLEVELPEVEEGDETEVTEDENPNVAAQLKNTSTDAPDVTEETAQDKYDRFMKEVPDARDIHGKQTQKRIARLTYEAKEAARQQEEAIAYAQRIQAENEQLKKTTVNQDGAFITEHMARLKTQLDTATNAHRQAYNLNDADAIAEATQNIARLTNQLDTATQTESRFRRKQETAEEVVVEPYQPKPDATADAAPVHAQSTIDPKAQDWADKNEWFGEDEELTKAALTIHRQLVTQDGYLPQSDQYYRELDARIERNYPEHAAFKKTGTDAPSLVTPSTVVTPGGAQGATRRAKTNTVHLTSSQAHDDKRLGVPLKEYAKSLTEYNSRK